MLILCVIWCIIAPLYAQPTDSLWLQANNAYAQNLYREALDTYQLIYDQGL